MKAPESSPQTFQLVPFEPLPAGLNLTLQGSCQRSESGDALLLHYQLSGDLDAVLIPEPEPLPSRRDGLWETTCFECFFAKPKDPTYWELNLSPSGDWNVYKLERYREGLRADPAYPGLRPQIHQHRQGLEISVGIPLPAPLREGSKVQLALCAVVALRHGNPSYWALRHTAGEADFHRRDSFALRV